MTTLHLQHPAERRLAVRRSRAVNRVTIGWNVIEGIVAVAAGTVA